MRRIGSCWQPSSLRTCKEISCRFVPCATGSASAESLCPRRVTNTGKASGTRNGQVISVVSVQFKAQGSVLPDAIGGRRSAWHGWYVVARVRRRSGWHAQNEVMGVVCRALRSPCAVRNFGDRIVFEKNLPNCGLARAVLLNYEAPETASCLPISMTHVLLLVACPPQLVSLINSTRARRHVFPFPMTHVFRASLPASNSQRAIASSAMRQAPGLSQNQIGCSGFTSVFASETAFENSF